MVKIVCDRCGAEAGHEDSAHWYSLTQDGEHYYHFDTIDCVRLWAMAKVNAHP